MRVVGTSADHWMPMDLCDVARAIAELRRLAPQRGEARARVPRQAAPPPPARCAEAGRADR